MNAGPSKEQLESLFKTSRKYFDDLAKEYYTKDRDFYNKNFAPFYSNPLFNTSKGKSTRLVIAVGLFTLIMGITIAMILFFNQNHTETKPIKQTEKYQVPLIEDDYKAATSIRDSVDKERIRLENLKEELIPREKEVKENTGKREVRSKPMERVR